MDKWTAEKWLSPSLAETYEGSEDFTAPVAKALLHQAGLIG